MSTKNIFDSIREINVKARVLLVGSAAEYGRIEEADNPVSEAHPLRPISIYGLTKVMQTTLMAYLRRVMVWIWLWPDHSI